MSKVRRPSVLALAAAVVATAVLALPALADRLLGTVTSVDEPDRQIVVREKDSGDLVPVKVTAKTEIREAKEQELDIDDIDRGDDVVVLHEAGVASKIAIKVERKKGDVRKKKDRGKDAPEARGKAAPKEGDRVEMLRWAPEDVREAVLLMNPGVREELKLTDEQAERIREAGRKVAEAHRDELQALREAEGRERFARFRDLVRSASDELKEDLLGVLEPEQRTRLEQLAIQFGGPRSLTDPEFRERLDLTEEQTEQLREIGEEFGRSLGEQRREGDVAGRDEARREYRALWRETMKKVRGVLTDEQRAKWRELAGEPFDFDLAPVRPDGGDEGRGRDEDRRGDGGRERRPEPKGDNP